MAVLEDTSGAVHANAVVGAFRKCCADRANDTLLTRHRVKTPRRNVITL
ncbi:MAG: hypothetical protein ACK5PU_01555 [bacterium]